MDEQLYRKTTVNPEQLLGTEFEASETGWCKHCGYAGFAHFIRESDGALLCLKKPSYGTR